MTTNELTAQISDVAFKDTDLTSIQTSTKLPIRLGWLIILLGVGGFFVWACTAPLEKGVPLSGTITVETNKKAVQHATGGTVEVVLVKEGDKVKVGDVVARMNNVQANADAETIRTQHYTALATEARLKAESSGLKTIDFPKVLLALQTDPKVASNMAAQVQLFSSRKLAKQNEWASLEESVKGLKAQNTGLENAKSSKEKQLNFAKEQLDSLRTLTQSGYIARTRLLDLEQSYAQITAAIQEDTGNIAKGKAQISEIELKRLQSIQEYQKEVRTQLADVQRDVASLANRLSGLDYNLDNILVKAPASGTVIGLAVFTSGAVIAPGFKIMDIVPVADALIVEGRLPVNLVDKLHPGLDIDMIFTAFNQNVTPHIPGTVTQISADRLIDERSGEPYYKLLAKVTPEGMKLVEKIKVRAGMPVDLFVKTGERTMMNYLLKPMIDHFKMALTQE
jgi:membrane fusion protein, protease secretion system